MASYVPANAYPTSGLEKFITGAQEGFTTTIDIAKKAEELKNLITQGDLARDTSDTLKKTKGDTDYTAGPGYEIADGKATTTDTTSTTGSGGGSYSSGGGKNQIKDSDLYTYLIDKGASKNEATLLTSAAGAESSFNPDTPHDGGIGYGLWGHNGTRLAEMRKSAGAGANDLIPWQKQADFALNELRSRPEGQDVNSATTPAQLLDAQRKYEVYKPGPTAHEDRRLASTTAYFNNPPTLGGTAQTQTAAATPATTTTKPALADPTSYDYTPAAPAAASAYPTAKDYVDTLGSAALPLPSEKPGGIEGQLGAVSKAPGPQAALSSGLLSRPQSPPPTTTLAKLAVLDNAGLRPPTNLTDYTAQMLRAQAPAGGTTDVYGRPQYGAGTGGYASASGGPVLSRSGGILTGNAPRSALV